MDDHPANQLRVLIVEDDRVTARDLESTLRRRGYTVVGIAHSASAAEPLIGVEKPDLVLLDIHLDNDEEGIALAIQLREEHGIPVIFITGYSEEALFDRARQARPAAFIRKPFSDAELAASLEAVVERYSAREQLSARMPGLEAVAAQLHQAVIGSDLGGRIVYMNAAAEDLTGWEAAEAQSHDLSTVAPLEELSERETPRTDAGGLHPRVVNLVSRSGERILVEERSAPITSKEEAVGLVTVLAEFASDPLPASPEDAPPTATAPDAPETEGASLPARSSALKKIAELSRDPAFRKLIRTRDSPVPRPTPSTATFPVHSASATPLIDDVGDPILKINEDGVIGYANAEAITVFGENHGLVGKPLRDCFDHERYDEYDDQFTRPLADGCRHRFDFHDSSRRKWFEVRVYPTGKGVLALFSDITSTRVESAELVRQQRLEGLGLLARGFAHDFNNHLTTLTGNISLARERHQDDPETLNMLSEAQAAASRATGLVQQLMTFARGGRPIRKQTRIPDLIRRILTEQRIKHPEIRYQFHGTETDLVANVDPAQISRLVENLVSNSAAAMADGGVLIVRCDKLQPEEVLGIKGSHTPSDEEHILVEVIDTGPGMSEEDLGRVFEPYFTTRKEDNATGIGLTVCESIARAHGGFIHLQSKKGKGTIASFCAPVGHRPDMPEGPESGLADYPNFDLSALSERAAESRKGEDNLLVGTRILILEDDAPIRRLMAATLRRAGHEVVETKDGRETIEIFKDALESGNAFHLLICDLTIENGVGGVETMRQLLQIDPGVLAIVSSGYSDAPAMSSPGSFGFKGVLPKPYAPSELRAAVHRILSAHRIIS
ncbi:MAG: response regulator [Verrucomicrobiales bacterium]